MTRALAAAICAAALWIAAPALADEAKPRSPAAHDASASVVVRAGKNESVNHAYALQFAEAVVLAANGALTLDVQESQGSVQNVKDAATLKGNYIFTAAPQVVRQARHGDKPFGHNRRYDEIRALFPIPYLTMHWVVRQDSGVKTLHDLAGQAFLPGTKGSFGERLTVNALQALGIDQRVQLIDIDANAGPAAVASKQVSGIALAGAYPLPAVLDLSKATAIRLVSLAPDELATVLAADDSTVMQLVPKGTYPGVDADVTTVALPAVVFATTRMSDKVAYAITKAFWSRKAVLAARNPPWQAVTPAALMALGLKLHNGASRFYREAGIAVPAKLR